MRCKGRQVFSGEFIELEFDREIRRAPPGVGEPPESAYLAPGFIDLQVNGFAGVDYNRPTTSLEEIAISLKALHSTGVTAFLPTVITGPPEAMAGALRNLARAKEELRAEPMAGFHMEGPHISPKDGPRGAHPKMWVRPPDIEEFRRWQDAARGQVRLVTLSPEWPEAPSYIEMLTREGVVVSIGHTNASREQIQTAIRAGATLLTHLGNAKASLPDHPNYIWEQLSEDRLAASFIVDGHHLPDSFVRVAVRAKGLERTVLVTDAVAPAMCAPGEYRLGEVEIELRQDGRVTLSSKTGSGGERLAGSSLRMDHAIANVLRITGVTLAEAVTMATRNPARVGQVDAKLRGLEPGDRADLVRFVVEQGRVRVLETFVMGERVFP